MGCNEGGTPPFPAPIARLAGADAEKNPTRQASKRVAVKTEAYPGRWTHHIVVSRPEELDDELVSWIREAYDFADAK